MINLFRSTEFAKKYGVPNVHFTIAKNMFKYEEMRACVLDDGKSSGTLCIPAKSPITLGPLV